MQYENIPFMGYPTSVVLIDDEKAFLTGIALELASSANQFDRYFEDATKGLDYINHKLAEQKSVSLADHRENNEGTAIIAQLHELIYDENRFSYPSTLVVDYNMPKMDGLSVCRAIDSVVIQKILLTVDDDTTRAISSLNERVIDQFIPKKAGAMVTELKLAIARAKARYFRQLTFQLMLSVSPELEKLLGLSSFVTLFHKVKAESNAVEFYLMDTSGSFLFLDKDAVPTWLIMRNEDDFIYQLEILSGLVEGGDIVEYLSKREKLLFLSSDEDYKYEFDAWPTFLVDATPLEEGYYYSISHAKFEQIEWSKVHAYNSIIDRAASK